MEEKRLIKREGNFLKRIFKKIKYFFEKNKKNIYRSVESVNLIQNDDTINKDENKYNHMKNQFFSKYENYKNGEIIGEDMSFLDTVLCNIILEQEASANRGKAISSKRRNNIITEKIRYL